MSILIKGAKMPKTCGYCFFNDFNICQIEHFTVADAVYHEERHESCPLVEIPPHGRLIDADVLIKNCEIWKETEIQDEHDDVWNRGIDACINEIKHHAPTVIESEGETEHE